MGQITESEMKFGTKYEDLEEVTRISSAELHLNTYFGTFYEEVLKNFYMASGYVLKTADLKRLTKNKMPYYQTNLFRPMLTQVAGNFKNTLPGVDISGVTPDDHKSSELIQDVNVHILYEANDIVYELAKAYVWAAIGRISWLKQEFSFENDNLGMVDIKHYNNFLKFDTTSTRRDLSDCQFIDDSAYFSPEEIIQIFAKKDAGLSEEIFEKSKLLLGDSMKNVEQIQTWAERVTRRAVQYDGELKGYDGNSLYGRGGDGSQTFSSGKYQDSGIWYTSDGRLKIVDWYERRQERVMYIRDLSNGKLYNVTNVIAKPQYRDKFISLKEKDWYDNDKLQLIRKHIGMPKIIPDSKMAIYQTSVCPALNIKLLDRKQQLQNGNFKFTQISYYDFHPNVLETKSLIDDIKDLVRSYNLRDNANLTYLLRSAKGGYFVEEDVKKKGLGNLEKNTINGITYVPRGTISLGKIKEKTVPPMNTALHQFMGQKREDIDLVSGVGPNSRGLRESSGESGKLFQSRVAQSDIMKEWVNENAQSALRTVVKNNVYYIQNFMKVERIIRITKDDGQKDWIKINEPTIAGIKNDVSKGKFDVSISITPYGRAAKEMERQKLIDLWKMTQQLLGITQEPKYKQVAEKIFIEVLKTTNVSGQADIMNIFRQPPSDLEQQNMQMIMEKQRLEAETQKADIGKKKAEAANKLADAEGKKIDNVAKFNELAQTNLLKDYQEATDILEELLKDMNIGSPTNQMERL